MRYPGLLVEGRLLRRYQRFLADFALADGSVVTAHCANPGSMLTCLEPGATGWLTRVDTTGRRLAYTWQVATVGGARIFVNPVLVNAVVAEAIERGRVPTRMSLWSDPEVQKLAPSAVFLAEMAKDPTSFKARPITPSIQEIYDAAEENIHAYLTDQVDIDTALQNAMDKIGPILKRDLGG